jgi:hypothetical protein
MKDKSKLFTSGEKRYIAKLRLNNPDRDIPSDTQITKALEKFSKEKVIKDLIIRVYDNILELELI